ncbi:MULTISPECIES: DUF6069 family protein [unclassified Streptomyces]|uniref:DUF6069 family protein n=1 Tax=unclassified Streptomyces TaxID=2593676 RepID=UPI002366B524|nr:MULTISPECIES: DUF6069 family protein [unclassified Streptomyces]MDF3140298.1 DUF6069 family protein [Streptomyces sp. T21Q-yed]WDF44115.1 DUF6069 family protein [Streptomyces sp. T12]
MSLPSGAVAVRRGPLVVLGGVLAAIVVASVADAVLALLALAAGAPDDFEPLKASSYIFLTAVGVVAGAVGWAIVRKVSKDPEALVRWLVPTLVVVSFVPDFLLFGDGGAIGVGALLLMHVVVAAAAVFAYRKVMPLS